MFEITPNDIAALNDQHLRTLVGLLAEAELRRRGFSTSAVTWGGHQDAKDGGVDVRVALPHDAAIDGFIPRPTTGFQVKAEYFAPSDIKSEMCPSGELRRTIHDLATQSGAYIIVSSKTSVTDSALQSRREAMSEAAGRENAAALILDFYDQTRLATWVRNYKGLVTWVREKIGLAFQGWRPYGSWAYDPKGVDGEYLLDDRLCIYTSTKKINDGCSVLEGIKCLRDGLRQPGRIVRLVGLSGLGKTRLVQALFDHRIGEQSLDPSVVLYTNMADDPEPQPTGVLSGLINSQERAILVIDNCGPDLHRRLSETCRADGSTVSLITVEYDIQDDEPEGTEVFKLLPSSDQLIEQLIIKRFPHILQVNARTIANFSSGNARVAIALAETVARNENIGSLNDTDLFHRLFRQRQEQDDSLLHVAQACSLVYSFQGEDISGPNTELNRLGSLVNKTSQEMYKGVSELKRRGLVQERSVWRAVLPHAIANRLATTALQDIPFAVIEPHLVNGGCERLAQSFSRRLGYLTSKEAKIIVRKWLAPNGLLEDVLNLNNLGQAMLNNIAPVEPEATLSALERSWLTGGTDEKIKIHRNVRLLRSIAYDAALFERCIDLILEIAEPEECTNKRDEATEAFTSLFLIHFSGTHAPIEQRLLILERLLSSADAKRRRLGVMGVAAALKTSHFDVFHNFEFGAHSRDYGYWPRNFDEVRHWFKSVLELVENVISDDGAAAPQVRNAIATELSGLWNRTKLFDELEHLCRFISAKQFWPEGWIAIKRTLQSEVLSGGDARLAALEATLRPENLAEKIRSIVLSRTAIDLDYFDGDAGQDISTRMAQTEALARSLGKAAATENVTFDELLPELLTKEGRLWSFGCGLSESSSDHEAIWNKLTGQLIACGTEKSRVDVLCGFIHELHKANLSLANTLLDRMLNNDRLAPAYPRLQASIPIDKLGVARLMRSLASAKTPIAAYRCLAWGGATGSISGEDLNELLIEISTRPSGFAVALDILSMKIHSYADKSQCPQEIIAAGRELLRSIEFGRELDDHDYDLAAVVQVCLIGEQGTQLTKEICLKLKDAAAKPEFYRFNHGYVLESLLLVQPFAALDEFLGGKEYDRQAGRRIFDYVWAWNKNPLDVVSPERIVTWCKQDPQIRFPRIARFITVSHNIDKPGARAWTEAALQLLHNAPDRIAVLKEFVDQLVAIHGWSGSRAAVIEANVKMLDEFTDYPDPKVVDFISQERIRIKQITESEKSREDLFDRQRDERFE